MRNHRTSGISRSILLLLAAGVLLSGLPANAQEKTEYAGFGVNLEGSVAKSGKIYITVERWSTPEERAALVTAFKTGGQDEMLKLLKQMPKAGFINMPDTMAYDLRYAYKFPAENGGTTVILGTDRRITSPEVWDQNRALDYPFELIELRLNAKGEGDGTLSWATKMFVNKDGNVVLESYGTDPIMLTKITTKVTKAK